MRIGVIGGGAAGMVAAITAKRNGAEAVILEAKDRLGQKILVTGNGRCNLGNLELNMTKYYGRDLSVPEACLNEFGTEETIRFFQDLGLVIKDRDGYLYPYCEQASVVLDILRSEVAALGINVLLNHTVNGIQVCKKGGFLIDGQHFDRIVLACGGKANVKGDAHGSGYDLAKELGHKIIPLVPALTFLKCEGDYWKALAGVRTHGKISLMDTQGNVLAMDCGELQLTEQGLSGIPCFQISRVAGYALRDKKRIKVNVDFLPELSMEEMRAMSKNRLVLRKNRTIEEYFTGILNKKIMQVLIRQAGLKGSDAAEKVSEGKLEDVLFKAKGFETYVSGTGDFQHAQVCAGGIDFGQVTNRLESKLVKGVYFAGELLDIDGKCGGYNLQWAWTSGYLAGKNAAEGDDKG